MVAPIVDEGNTFAALVVVDRNIQARFGREDVARVKSIAEQLAVSLRRGMLHERLEFEARHDALTNLPARTLFERHVGEAVAVAGDPPAAWVVMLDLDRFKEVNDTLGHHAGDDLLIQFAGRMSAMLGPGDVLARLAGDEFAILCSRPSHDEIVEFAQACVVEGGRPVVLDDLEIVVTVSVGVAEITPEDRDAVQPMRRADIAMYNAKWQRTGVEFYRDEIDRRTPARLSMLGDLRTAIENDELEVVYQPKLDLATGVVVGVEALVRWVHPSPRRSLAERVRPRRRGHRSDQTAHRSRPGPWHPHAPRLRPPPPAGRAGGQSVDPRPVRLAAARSGPRPSRSEWGRPVVADARDHRVVAVRRCTTDPGDDRRAARRRSTDGRRRLRNGLFVAELSASAPCPRI